MGWLNSVGQSFQNAIDTAVGTAKKAWTAVTTKPVETAQYIWKETKPTAIVQKAVSVAKDIKTALPAGDLDPDPTKTEWIGAPIKRIAESYQKLQDVKTRQPETQRLQQVKTQLADVQKKTSQKAFEEASSFEKFGRKFGAAYGAGLTGMEAPEHGYTTGNQAADIISNLMGYGLGFMLGGEITGAAKVGRLAVTGLEKAIPALATTAGKKMIPQIASAVAKGAVREGVEGVMLSGIHSILNADTKEEAIERAKEYGLYGAVFGATIHGAGTAVRPIMADLLGTIAKKIKGAVPSGSKIELPKGFKDAAPLKNLPNVTPRVMRDIKSVTRNLSKVKADVIESTANILKHVVDTPEKYPPSMVLEAKLKLIDIADKLDHLSAGNKLEITDELFPELDNLKPKIEGKKITPQEATGKATVLKGANDEIIRTKVEAIEGKPDEFWYEWNGEKHWGKTDYWEIIKEKPKKKTPKKPAPKKETVKKPTKKTPVQQPVTKKPPAKPQEKLIDLSSREHMTPEKARRVEEAWRTVAEIEKEKGIPPKGKGEPSAKKEPTKKGTTKKEPTKKETTKEEPTKEESAKKEPTKKKGKPVKQRQAELVQKLERQLADLKEGKTTTNVRSKTPENAQIKKLRQEIAKEKVKLKPPQKTPTKRKEPTVAQKQATKEKRLAKQLKDLKEGKVTKKKPVPDTEASAKMKQEIKQIRDMKKAVERQLRQRRVDPYADVQKTRKELTITQKQERLVKILEKKLADLKVGKVPKKQKTPENEQIRKLKRQISELRKGSPRKLRSPSDRKQKTQEQKVRERDERLTRQLKDLQEGKTPSKPEKLPETQVSETIRRNINEIRQQQKAAQKDLKAFERQQPIAVPKGEYEYIHTEPAKIAKERPELRNLTEKQIKKAVKPYTKDVRTAISGKEDVNILKANKLATEIEKMAKKEQEAITRYVDALLSKEDLSDLYSKATTDIQKKQIQQAMNLSPNAKKASEKLVKFLKEHQEYAQEIGQTINTKEALQHFKEGKIYESLSAGEFTSGKTPEILKASDIIRSLGKKRAASIAKFEMVNSDPVFFKKIGTEVPEKYARISRNIAVPEEFADRLKPLFDEDFIRSAKPNAFVKTQQAIRQTRLSFDAFTDLKALLTDVATTGGYPKRLLQWVFGKKIMNAENFPKELTEHFISDGGLKVSPVERGIDILEPGQLYKTPKNKLLKVPTKVLQKIMNVEEMHMNWLFNNVQTSLKLHYVEAQRTKWRRWHKNATKEEDIIQLRKICEAANAIYKGVNLKSIGTNPNILTALQKSAMLAPKWKYASFQLWKLAAKGNPYALKSIGRQIAFMQLMAQGINYITTGHSTFENEEGHELDTKLWGDTYYSFATWGLEDAARIVQKTVKAKGNIFKGILDWAGGVLTSAPIIGDIQSKRYLWGVSDKDSDLTKYIKISMNIAGSVLPDTIKATPGLFYLKAEEFLAAFIGGRVVKKEDDSKKKDDTSKKKNGTSGKKDGTKLKSTEEIIKSRNPKPSNTKGVKSKEVKQLKGTKEIQEEAAKRLKK